MIITKLQAQKIIPAIDKKLGPYKPTDNILFIDVAKIILDIGYNDDIIDFDQARDLISEMDLYFGISSINDVVLYGIIATSIIDIAAKDNIRIKGK